MQSGDRFFHFFYVPFGALCWVHRGRQKRYKINVCFLIFKMTGTLGAVTKFIPKSKICKICIENKCFVRLT